LAKDLDDVNQGDKTKLAKVAADKREVARRTNMEAVGSAVEVHKKADLKAVSAEKAASQNLQAELHRLFLSIVDQHTLVGLPLPPWNHSSITCKHRPLYFPSDAH
jgi:hypothetical protein